MNFIQKAKYPQSNFKVTNTEHKQKLNLRTVAEMINFTMTSRLYKLKQSFRGDFSPTLNFRAFERIKVQKEWLLYNLKKLKNQIDELKVNCIRKETKIEELENFFKIEISE